MPHKNVLIVDDVAELGRMLQAALATLSDTLVVRVVPSAEEGLLEATRNPVDLVISDIRLPGISGLEFTRRIRLRHKAVKVIQISGMDDASLKQQSIEAGADLFFRKPLALGEFLNAVEKLLDLKKPVPPVASSQPPTASSQSPTALGQPLTALGQAITEPLSFSAKTSGTAAASGVVLPGRLKEQISQLRQMLNSPAAGLLDELGHIQLQEGDLEETLGGTGILPAVMDALNSGARVPLSMGQVDTEIVIAFRGAMIDLMAVSLNPAMALVIAFKHGPTRVATAIAFDEITRARLNILGFLREKGALPVSRFPGGKTGTLTAAIKEQAVRIPDVSMENPESVVPQDEEKPVISEPLENLAALISSVALPDVAPDQKLAVDLTAQEEALKKQAENVDDFWAAAVDHQPAANSTTRPNTLSFEQARKMGLTPSDADKPKDGKS